MLKGNETFTLVFLPPPKYDISVEMKETKGQLIVSH
jgi:hypothetical protein